MSILPTFKLSFISGCHMQLKMCVMTTSNGLLRYHLFILISAIWYTLIHITLQHYKHTHLKNEIKPLTQTMSVLSYTAAQIMSRHAGHFHALLFPVFLCRESAEYEVRHPNIVPKSNIQMYKLTVAGTGVYTLCRVFNNVMYNGSQTCLLNFFIYTNMDIECWDHYWRCYHSHIIIVPWAQLFQSVVLFQSADEFKLW